MSATPTPLARAQGDSVKHKLNKNLWLPITSCVYILWRTHQAAPTRRYFSTRLTVAEVLICVLLHNDDDNFRDARATSLRVCRQATHTSPYLDQSTRKPAHQNEKLPDTCEVTSSNRDFIPSHDHALPSPSVSPSRSSARGPQPDLQLCLLFSG